MVAAGKEKFQGSRVVPKQQAHHQTGAALENIFPQPPDGNPAVSVVQREPARVTRPGDKVLVGRLLPRRPDIWAARQRSPAII